MFSKPEWFGPGRRAGRVRPRSLLGWMYSTVWLLVLLLPAVLLAQLHRGPEAGLWLAAMSLGWWADLGPVRRAHRLAHASDLFVIDDQTDITRRPPAPRSRFAFRRASTPR